MAYLLEILENAHLFEYLHEILKFNYCENNFKNAHFMKTNARKARFVRASLEESSVIDSDFRETNMEEACLIGVVASNTQFEGARLKNVVR